MNYLFVEVSAKLLRADAESADPQYRCVDGRSLRSGIWAAIVTELPASRTASGRELLRGFYAVLWPMGEDAPRYDEGPFYFGPFLSKRMADGLILDVSAAAGESVRSYGPEIRRVRHREKRCATP